MDLNKNKFFMNYIVTLEIIKNWKFLKRKRNEKLIDS